MTSLAEIPGKWAVPPPDKVSKLNRGRNVVLDYMGHADVTLALIEIDPTYDYGWVTDEHGRMMVERADKLHVLHGWLRVLGQTRWGVGTCEVRKEEYHKELIGDLLRNCAMRFGVATALWSKVERSDNSEEPPPPPPGPVLLSVEAINRFVDACETEGLDPSAVINRALPGGAIDDPLTDAELPAMRAAFRQMVEERAEKRHDETQGGGKGAGDSVPPDSGGARPASRGQVGVVKGNYDRLGLERDAQLVMTATIIGHEIDTHNDLTVAEAVLLIDRLAALEPADIG